MKFDTNQQPTKKTKVEKKKFQCVDSDYLIGHGRNYCDCLEYVQEYVALAKNFVVVYVDVKSDLEHFFQEENLSWQVWRKHYNPSPKYYLANPTLDKSVLEHDNTITGPKEGYKRLYRGIPKQDFLSSQKSIKKPKSFITKFVAK